MKNYVFVATVVVMLISNVLSITEADEENSIEPPTLKIKFMG